MNAIPRRVWLEINLTTLTENYCKIAAAVTPATTIAVLKANAYGLGVLPIAQALSAAGVNHFGVAEPHEAIQLVPLQKRVQVLSSILPDEIPAMVENRIILPATDIETVTLISQESVRQGVTTAVHLKIDTGMGRLGIRVENAPQIIRAMMRLPNLAFDGIFSHFPCAYDVNSELTRQQIDQFCALLADLAHDGIVIPLRHIANSDAINNYPRACKQPFNVVRTGINLHGSFDTAGQRSLHVIPVLTLKTRIASIRNLAQGTGIGYGHTHRLSHPMRVAVISAGYADGLPLALSNTGYVIIHGKRCPVLGRISMDYTVVSLEHVAQAAVGDEVICLGQQGDERVTVEDWAAIKETHPYEIICSFGSRVERVYTR